MHSARQIALLQERGVRLVAPETVLVGAEVIPARIAAGVEIHPGCRLYGASLSIGPACVLGEEGPVTIRDCQLGARVRVRGGFLERATLLDDTDAGSGAHVRPGSLLEEHVSFGHCVGLKQTVLLPFTALGSLINFCDCLMAGGTGKENHSEVGSSYIHFNFTAHQDKATPSLIGDVPQGVWLDQPPIFLGGQGGLVGPCRIAYGTVLAAGQICRHDVLTPGTLVREASSAKRMAMPYDPSRIGDVAHRVAANRKYLGNLLAMDAWWRLVRVRFVREDWQRHCHEGALCRLAEMFDERLRRLDQFAQKVAVSCSLPDSTPETSAQRAFLDAWPAQRAALQAQVAARDKVQPTAEVMALTDCLPGNGGCASSPAAANDYLAWVRTCAPQNKQRLTAWLQSLADALLEDSNA